jgi:hypothetical protein
LPEEIAKVPFRPSNGNSTAQVAAKAAGTPTTARIKVYVFWRVIREKHIARKEITHITVCDVQRGVTKVSTTTRQTVFLPYEAPILTVGRNRNLTHRNGRKLL